MTTSDRSPYPGGRETSGETRYDVYLISPGQRKLEVIKVIRLYTDLGLVDAKSIAEAARGQVCFGVERDVAENVVRDLSAAGARAEIRETAGAGGGTQTDSGGDRVYAVILDEMGPREINVIKVVRQHTDLGLKEAKDLVESAPREVRAGLTKDDAEEIKRDLSAAGARAEVRKAATTGGGFEAHFDDDRTYAVILEVMGPREIEVIKVVRQYTDLGLKEAKDLVESAPREVRSGLRRDVAENIKGDLEAAGARAEIRRAEGSSSTFAGTGRGTGGEAGAPPPGYGGSLSGPIEPKGFIGSRSCRFLLVLFLAGVMVIIGLVLVDFPFKF